MSNEGAKPKEFSSEVGALTSALAPSDAMKRAIAAANHSEAYEKMLNAARMPSTTKGILDAMAMPSASKEMLDMQRRATAPRLSRPESDPSIGPARSPLSALKSSADLGSLVRSARKAAKLDQQGLADLAGVGRRFVSELENGKPTIEFGKAIAVAAALGIDLFARKR